MQYTLTDVPEHIDKALRARAQAQGKSPEEVIVEALRISPGLGEKKRDLGFMVGGMTPEDIEAVRRVHREIDVVDPE